MPSTSTVLGILLALAASGNDPYGRDDPGINEARGAYVRCVASKVDAYALPGISASEAADAAVTACLEERGRVLEAQRAFLTEGTPTSAQAEAERWAQGATDATEKTARRIALMRAVERLSQSAKR